MDLSFSSVAAGIVFGVIGLTLFRQGKRNLNYSVLCIGLVMMIYPYFTPNAWFDWGIGLALCGLAYYLW